MKALDHPNIVKLLGVTDTEEAMFIIMEYVSGGDMCNYLDTHGRMTEAQARGLFQQLVSALQHCHQRGVVHRDLKPANLLFDGNMNLKLADFGFSNMCDARGKLDTVCGTVPYAAPEVLLGQRYSGPAVDVWSLGVVLYVMVTGFRPFVGKDLRELREQIVTEHYRIPTYLSLEVRSLLRNMIARDPSDRGTLPDLMRHPWVTMGRKKPPQPPCEEDLEGTVTSMRDSAWDDRQDGGEGSVSSKKPTVVFSIRAAGPLSSGDFGGSELEPLPSPELSTRETGRLHQGENVPQREDQQAGQKTSEPACPPASLESRTATPSPARQCGPGASPSTSSRTGAPAGTSCPLRVCSPGRSPHAAQPESMSSSIPSGHSQKKQGVAGRIWTFFARHLCCSCKLPSMRRHNKVKPI
ncbi:serine/threonine-protein kinase MARK2-like [Kogia breviceps]|uniref:serine/threonine-protein kinase MARK2-like n=1 Tax=Kogia breviceps TaxID=27615 RepID=UPI0034D36239